MDKLRAYSWPGNVRELENIIERAMILVKAERLEAGDLDFGRRAQQAAGGGGAVPAPIARSREQTQPMPHLPPLGHSAPPPTDPTASGSRPLSERLADEERREIVAAVDKSSGNIALAARMLGINRSTLYYRLRKHGLEHLLPTKGVVGTASPEGGDEGAPDPGS
jgi:DNA-binding NtrC family response regulator